MKKIKGEEIERIMHNEVRLDNYVLGFLTKEWLQVDWLVIKHLSDGNVQAAFYDHQPVYIGIPLTPEILLKCGFNYDQITYYKDVLMLAEGDDRWDCWFRHFQHTNRLLPIKYLHQLQNLYFALTGIELEIKL